MIIYGADYNKGYIDYGYNTYEDNAFVAIAPYIENIKNTSNNTFCLGTKDWASSKIDYTGGRSLTTETNQDPEEQN
jgi:hypothetical protein